MNRAQRRKNAKIQNIINDIEELKANTRSNTIKKSIEVYSTSVAMVLHDKFGFGEKRVKRVMDMIYEQFDSINKGLVSLDDIQQTLIEECKYIVGGSKYDEEYDQYRR